MACTCAENGRGEIAKTIYAMVFYRKREENGRPLTIWMNIGGTMGEIRDTEKDRINRENWEQMITGQILTAV